MKIAHVIVPSFACQLEALNDPALAGRSLIVGGNPWEKGAVLESSLEAMNCGVYPGTTLRVAQQLCPTAIFLPPREDLYSEVHRQIVEALRPFSPYIETVGLGSISLEVSGLELRYPSDELLGKDVCEAVFGASRLKPQIGIAATKFTAMVASLLASPESPGIVPKGQEHHFLGSISIDYLTLTENQRRLLLLLGINTLGRLTKIPPGALFSRFGVGGQKLHQLAAGEDPTPIISDPEEPSLSIERSFVDPIEEVSLLEDHLKQMIERAVEALSERGLVCGKVEMLIAFGKEQQIIRQANFNHPTAEPGLIFRRSIHLIQTSGLESRITDIRMVFRNLQPLSAAMKQAAILTGVQRLRRQLEGEIARLNHRFGQDLLQTASHSFLPDPLPVQVREEGGSPLALQWQGRWLRVESLEARWRELSEWWRKESLRDYYKVYLSDGSLRVVFCDWVEGRWYLEKRHWLDT